MPTTFLSSLTPMRMVPPCLFKNPQIVFINVSSNGPEKGYPYPLNSSLLFSDEEINLSKTKDDDCSLFTLLVFGSIGHVDKAAWYI